ncbi:hypothetical protein [Streptomyces sp. NPDC001970]
MPIEEPNVVWVLVGYSKAGGPMSLLVAPAAWSTPLIRHGATRRCTDPACDAVIDDGIARPAHAGATVPNHTLTYPLEA